MLFCLLWGLLFPFEARFLYKVRFPDDTPFFLLKGGVGEPSSDAVSARPLLALPFDGSGVGSVVAGVGVEGSTVDLNGALLPPPFEGPGVGVEGSGVDLNGAGNDSEGPGIDPFPAGVGVEGPASVGLMERRED